MLKQQDEVRACNKFLLRQFLIQTSKQGQGVQQLHHALQATKQENTRLKQAHNSDKMRYEKALENLQQQLASANKKMEEKDRQLYQFRKLHERMTPQSPNQDQQQQQQTSSSRRVSNAAMIPPGSSRRSNPPAAAAPPLQGFMIQKEAQERARQRALVETPLRAPMRMMSHGSGHPPSNPYVTTTTTSTPRSSGGNSSQGSESGGIRDLTSSSFAFAGGGSGDYQNKRRRGAMSPSQALSMQPPGSYSVSRGPTNYFHQQQQHGGGYMSNSRR